MGESATFGVLAGGMVAFSLIAFLCIILLIAARWKIFIKAGEKGWKSIIPLYSDYVQWRIAWKKKGLFWLVILLGFIGLVLMSAGGYPLETLYGGSRVAAAIDASMNIALLRAGTAMLLICAILEIISVYKLFKSFGHGLGWFILSVFFPNIMLLVLGFGASQYQGPQ